MSELALWLVPPVTRRAEYATVIDDLAEQFGTPRFVPHVTLLTGVVDCDERRLRTLAGACRGLELRPRGLASYDEYYRALVVEIDLSEELRRARELAIKTFRGGAAPYEPHLSLMYGDLPEAARSEALRTIETTHFPAFVPEVLQAVGVDGPPDRWPSRVQLAL